MGKKNRGFTGRHHTEEFKREQSQRVKKLWTNPEWRERHRKASLGKLKHTEEHKKKISKLMTGSNNPMKRPEVQEKMKRTMLKKYGVKNAAHHPKARDYQLNRNAMKQSEIAEKVRDSLRGRTLSEERREKMRGPRPDFRGENSSSWKGGWNGYWHELAWKKFGKENCERCGISLEKCFKKYGDRLTMHCTSVPKDYTLMIETNWMTLCNSCHPIIERQTQTK